MAKRQKWSVGDVFVIPLSDGSWGPAQIIGREPSVLNSVSVALFDCKVGSKPDALQCRLTEDSAFATLFVTRDLLDSGVWVVVGVKPVAISRRLLPFESTRSKGFVGATVVGSGNVNKFVDAWFGLHPWDAWHDPRYLDKLLLDPSRRPARVKLKSDGT